MFWIITANQFLILPHRDNIHGTKHLTRMVLSDSGFVNVSDHDIAVVQIVSAIASHRAALLVAITTSVLLNRMPYNDVTIAIDGSVYKNHPRMNAWLNRLIDIFTNSEKTVSRAAKYPLATTLKSLMRQLSNTFLHIFAFQFRLLLAEDGSGKGAALTAAIAMKLREK